MTEIIQLYFSSDFVSLDEAEVLSQMLKDMESGFTENEMQVSKVSRVYFKGNARTEKQLNQGRVRGQIYFKGELVRELLL